MQLKDWLGKRNTFVRVLRTAALKGKVRFMEEQFSAGDGSRLCPGAVAAFNDTMKLIAAIEVLEDFAAGKRPLECGAVIT